MLLGKLQYNKKNKIKIYSNSSFLHLLINALTSGKISPQSMQKLLLKINEFGGALVALGSTLVSIYTGLKALS
jgi:hypothetical protein